MSTAPWQKHSDEQHRYALKYPEKVSAQQSLNQAIIRGRIIRPDHCSKCGLVCRPHGHHPDYSKRFEVIWLCTLCHAHEHRRIGVKESDGSLWTDEQQTHCKNGHRFEGENLRIRMEKGRPQQVCRMCQRENQRLWRLKQKALREQANG